MKQRDITPCTLCGRGLMADHQMTAYKVRVTQMVFDLPAIQRAHGLEMMLGQAAPLASVLGLDEDMAVSIGTAKDVLVCQTCAITPGAILHDLVVVETPEES